MYIGRSWLGLRFLRSLIILNLPDVLVYVRVINASSSIRLCHLISVFLTVVRGLSRAFFSWISAESNCEKGLVTDSYRTRHVHIGCAVAFAPSFRLSYSEGRGETEPSSLNNNQLHGINRPSSIVRERGTDRGGEPSLIFPFFWPMVNVLTRRKDKDCRSSKI